jgi:NO-binding membrane sensor protein with MHYT domain
MHYLGNASINNYSCVYQPAYVIGSAIIAIVASNVALAMFFVFRAMWANAWWKRVISAVVLAGAVSGMHWCASVGTRYRLKRIKPNGNEPSRTGTVVVVICLVSVRAIATSWGSITDVANKASHWAPALSLQLRRSFEHEI